MRRAEKKSKRERQERIDKCVTYKEEYLNNDSYLYFLFYGLPPNYLAIYLAFLITKQITLFSLFFLNFSAHLKLCLWSPRLDMLFYVRNRNLSNCLLYLVTTHNIYFF